MCAQVLQDEDVPNVSFFEVLKFNIPEWPYIFVGIICAIINGVMQPLFAIVFSKIITVGSSQFQWVELWQGDKQLFLSSVAGVCRYRPGICQEKVRILLPDVCRHWLCIICHHVFTGKCVLPVHKPSLTQGSVDLNIL